MFMQDEHVRAWNSMYDYSTAVSLTVCSEPSAPPGVVLLLPPITHLRRAHALSARCSACISWLLCSSPSHLLGFVPSSTQAAYAATDL